MDLKERVLSAGAGLARLVLVLVAFALSMGSIGLSATRGFCPEQGDAASLAAPTTQVSLATIVPDDDTGDGPDDDGADTPGDGSGEGGQDAPADDGSEAPADDGSEAPADEGACPGGVQRCLPPLFSSVLILGDLDCHEQAGARLRGILVPAFVGSTVLLAGAWWLRPSRLFASQDRETRRALR